MSNIKRYYPSLADLISSSVFSDPGHPLHFINTLLNSSGLFNKLFYKDLQFSKSPSGDNGFYRLKLVSNTKIEFNVFNTGVSVVINRDNDANDISALPISVHYEWKVIRLFKAFQANTPAATAEQIFNIVFEILRLNDQKLLGNAINVSTVYNPAKDPVEQFEDQLVAKYPAYSRISTASTEQLTDIATHIQNAQPGLTVRQAIYDLYVDSSTTAGKWNNLNDFFRLLINKDVKEYALDFITPKIKAQFDLRGDVEVPRKWLQPMKEVPAGSGNWQAEDENPAGSGLPKASFKFAEARCYLDSQIGAGLDIDFVLSSNQRVLLGKTGIQLEISTLKLDLREDRNIPEADTDGRAPSFNGVYIRNATVVFPANWDSSGHTNAAITARDILIGDEGGISGRFTVAGQNAEVYAPLVIGGVSKVIVHAATGYVEVENAGATAYKSFPYELGKELYIRDEANNYFKVDAAGVVTLQPVPNNGAPLLQFDFANGMHIGLYSFHLELHQNTVLSSSIVGQLSGGILQNPIRISLEFDNGFIVKAYVPNGQPIVNNNNVEIKLDGLEFGKSNDEWLFGIAGQLAIKKEIKVIGKLLPQYFKVYRLFYKKSTGLAFDLEAGWKNGTFIRGNNQSGLQGYLPVDYRAENYGGILKGIQIKAKATPGEAGEIQMLLVGAGVKLGIINATVDDFGVKLLIQEAADEADADFGGTKTQLSLVGPRGLSVSLDEGEIKGGGYLYFGENEYRGYFHLTISKFRLNAVGILNTRLPNGAPGYSLLILITAEFNPIQIGLGFTLNGVGGMLGLHRTLDADALQGALRSGGLENVLFPQNVNDDASAIITTLNTLFPISEGRFLIAPMAKIGWGTPTLLTIDLGILLDLPKPVRLAIVGVLRCTLPDPDNPLLVLKCAFAGVIDFDRQYLRFDARIYDSRIKNITLSGQMSLRIFWGRDKEMLLSVGGFHPAYTPPVRLNLPRIMERMAVALNEGSLQMRLEAYYALTSNTVQLGAALRLDYTFYSFKAEGHLAFDALFQFHPFYFNVRIQAGVSISWSGNELLGVHLDFTLEGPKPWHAKGYAEFEVCGCSKKLNLDKTWGGERTPEPRPTIALRPQLQAAFADQANWQTITPGPGDLLVSLRRWDDSLLVVHPNGRLQISQKTAPLEITLARYGQANLSDPGRYRINSLTIAGVAQQLTPLREAFSPSQYRDMNDKDKLKAPSFEYLAAGIEARSTADWQANYYVMKEMSYDTIIKDKVRRPRTTGNGTGAAVDTRQLASFISGGLIGQNPVGAARLAQLRNAVRVLQAPAAAYQVADRDQMLQTATATGIPLTFGSEAEARDYQQSLGILANFTKVIPAYYNA